MKDLYENKVKEYENLQSEIDLIKVESNNEINKLKNDLTEKQNRIEHI